MQIETEKVIPWIVNDISRFIIHIRRVLKQDPRIREASDRVRKSLYRPYSKPEEKHEIHLSHE